MIWLTSSEVSGANRSLDAPHDGHSTGCVSSVSIYPQILQRNIGKSSHIDRIRQPLRAGQRQQERPPRRLLVADRSMAREREGVPIR
ncbi:MAG TPA: hypothetical protein DEU95_07095 [Chloroflexi bacterium]|nr:hypothetical protein [Chloroflexota bacterium]